VARRPAAGARHPILALTGDHAGRDRAYDGFPAVPGDRPMPTSVGYRIGAYGPMFSVGYRVSTVGGWLDPHNVTAAAAATPLASPDGLLGANLSYSFR
jgi:hypothetical protein